MSKTFYIETFGCQMNAHDSEKVVGTLLSQGYQQVETVEEAGLIRRRRDGHIQSCVLAAEPMATADQWLSHYRRFWGARLDRLADFVETREG